MIRWKFWPGLNRNKCVTVHNKNGFSILCGVFNYSFDVDPSWWCFQCFVRAVSLRRVRRDLLKNVEQNLEDAFCSGTILHNSQLKSRYFFQLVCLFFETTKTFGFLKATCRSQELFEVSTFLSYKVFDRTGRTF